jgi:hypothetical protein
MSNQPRKQVDRLELHPETIRDLTEAEAESVHGRGVALATASNASCALPGACVRATSPLHTCDPTVAGYHK